MQAQLQERKQTPRLFRGFFGILITTISIVGGFFLISIALAKAMHQKELRDKIRHFNRRALNPLTLKIAGNRLRVYGSLKHIGLRSGREYTIPVVVRPLGDGFVIPLPYGTDVDWCQNVMAAGKRNLYWNGNEYCLEKPELITPSEALKAFPMTQEIIFSTGGIEHYLVVCQPKIDQ